MYKCTGCDKWLLATSFSIEQRSSFGRSSRCKTCTQRYIASRPPEKRTERNAYYTQWVKKRSNPLREYVVSYLQTHSCVDCGFADIRCLEFDHVRGIKRFSIANYISGRNVKADLENLVLEIEKCDVRCANCHRIVTCERGKHYRNDFIRSRY